jgi:hypothetical protein
MLHLNIFYSISSKAQIIGMNCQQMSAAASYLTKHQKKNTKNTTVGAEYHT